MSLKMVLGVGAGVGLVGGAGYLAAKAMVDDVGDEVHARRERLGGRNDVGYEPRQIADEVFDRHDVSPPKDMIGGDEYGLREEVVRSDGRVIEHVDHRNAAEIAAFDENEDEVVTRDEFEAGLASLAGRDGIISGEEALQLTNVIRSLDVDIRPLGAKLDASGAAAMLRAGSPIEARIGTQLHQVSYDSEHREYDISVRDDIHHAREGTPWKPVASYDGARDAVKHLSEAGASSFVLAG